MVRYCESMCMNVPTTVPHMIEYEAFLVIHSKAFIKML